MKGTVATYVRSRGFGFLTSDSDCHLLVFFHIKDWVPAQTPAIGAEVSYDVVEGKSGKGPQARSVNLISAQTVPAEVLAEKAQAQTEVD
jgi:cold shock CspA family protein